MATAYTYARYSSDKQHESSIEAQQDATRRWAQAHGVTILHEFADRGISGTTDERPEFQALIARCRRQPADYVLIHKYDRFARSRYDSAIYGRLIEQTGARLVAVAQDFGTTPEAVIMEGLMQAWAEYYSRNLSTETIKGLRVRAAAGLIVGGTAPFGYREQDGALVVDPDEAEWVRRFFDGYQAGRAVGEMTREAARAGVLGRRGAPITRDSVRKLLTREVYTGTYTATVGGETFRLEHHHEAIISDSQWKDVQHMIEANMASRRAAGERTYLLTGIVRCGICGGRMRGHTQVHGGVEYPSYFCPGRHEGDRLRSIRTEDLDRAVIGYVRSILTPELRARAAETLTAYIDGRAKDAKKRAPSAAKRIQALEKKISAITQNMSAGVLPPSVLQRLGEQVTEYEAEIDALRAAATVPPDPREISVAEFFADAAAIDEETPVEVARQVVRRFVREVIVTNDEVEIISTFAEWLAAKYPETKSYISGTCRNGQGAFDIIITRRILRAPILVIPFADLILCNITSANIKLLK